MMFKVSEEEEMIEKMVGDFADEEVEGSGKEGDEEEGFEMEVFGKMGELGVRGIRW